MQWPGSGSSKPVQQAGGASPGGIPSARMHTRPAWILTIEHAALRVVSLAFSLASAYAISRVFAPYDGDGVRLVVDIFIAGGFGVLGYFISRSIAYRLFFNQSVWAYIPICLIVEGVEVFCNYVMGAAEVPHQPWLLALPLDQRPTVTGLAYVVLAIIPAVTLFLAVLDMDLERRKLNPTPQPKQPKGHGVAAGASASSSAWSAPTSSPQATYPASPPPVVPTISARPGYGGQSVQGAPGKPPARPGVNQPTVQFAPGQQGGSSNGAAPLAGTGSAIP